MIFFEEVAQWFSNAFAFLGGFNDIGDMFSSGWNAFTGFVVGFWEMFSGFFTGLFL